MVYLFFLGLFMFVITTELKKEPYTTEWILVLMVSSYAMEEMRQVSSNQIIPGIFAKKKTLFKRFGLQHWFLTLTLIQHFLKDDTPINHFTETTALHEREWVSNVVNCKNKLHWQMHADIWSYLSLVTLTHHLTHSPCGIRIDWGHWQSVNDLFSLYFFPQIAESDAQSFRHKLQMWSASYWNMCDALAILLFFTALLLRLNGRETLLYGHVLYAVDIIFWILRILDMFGVNKHIGPYVVMIGKMVRMLMALFLVKLWFQKNCHFSVYLPLECECLHDLNISDLICL